jgi:hypothetical protein
MNMHPNARDAAEFVGFAWEDTGCGCSALTMMAGSVEVVITSAINEACAPEALDGEPVYLGEYWGGWSFDPEDAAHHEFPSLRDALLHVYGPIAGAPLPAPLAQ